MDKDGDRAGVAVLLWPPAHCCLLSAVQWMSLTVPPALDSAGKVVEQIPLWEFLQCSGESSEQLHSWEADLVFQLNGKGASLFLCLPVIIYLQLSLLPCVTWLFLCWKSMSVAVLSLLGTFQKSLQQLQFLSLLSIHLVVQDKIGIN